ncbi:hypothetical protein NQ318_018896 [Aromia moschata]|uniref:Uncharacterized protein n=1 Tax=Aromia moschata TaxID=1265417 RepID=A0AAV8ZJ68_9CUCU|nr:hypothetical protein NQ318_018896 [Aromia moschata]
MFFTCCRNSSSSVQEYSVENRNENNVKPSTQNGNINSPSSESHDHQLNPDNQIPLGTANEPLEFNNNKDANGIRRERVRSVSTSSVKSVQSFYSVKSTANSDADFYSVYSNDSFKST